MAAPAVEVNNFYLRTARRQRVILASMASSGRKTIPDPVTNRLFALSGNQCAFPGCTNAVSQ
jgi:hypothetical protein